MKQIFLPGDKLEEWAEKGQVIVVGDVAEIAGKGLKYKLEEAVRFSRCLSGASDPRALVGKVLTTKQIEGLNAEHFPGSVIMGDDAYEVSEGFLGNLIEPSTEKPAEIPTPPSKSAKAPQKLQAEQAKQVKESEKAKSAAIGDDDKKEGGEKSDVELLTEFLLDKL
ncbi:MAG: hypothetical protein Kow0090_18650 [Myxococcota bacterium]